MKDALGDRMKGYERATRTALPPRSWTIIRLDGRAFHTWTRGMPRPYSAALIDTMASGMRTLCADIAGTVIGYQQSDEISLVVTDFGRPDTQAFYGGQVQKIVSVAASVLTAAFERASEALPQASRLPAIFDARAFTVPDRDEVRNYLLWRQRDARRNAISMLASSHFSHKELHGMSTSERRAMLLARGSDLGNVDSNFMDGQTCHRERRIGNVTWVDQNGTEHVAENVERWEWLTQPAPNLDCQPDTFLDRILPPDPEPVSV